MNTSKQQARVQSTWLTLRDEWDGDFANDKMLGESSYFQECFPKMFSIFFCIKKNDTEAFVFLLTQ